MGAGYYHYEVEVTIMQGSKQYETVGGQKEDICGIQGS